MEILFLVALVLAWPTKGLSILCFIALMTVLGVMDGKRKHRDASQRRQVRQTNSNDSVFPSWISNNKKYEEFIHAIVARAKAHSVPEEYTLHIFQSPKTKALLLHIAGTAEQQKVSFEVQKNHVIKKVVELYRKTQKQGSEPVDETLPSWANNVGEYEDFISWLLIWGKRYSVPEEYTLMLFQNPDTRTVLLQLARSQELQNAKRDGTSFYLQKMKVIEKINDMYNDYRRSQTTGEP